MTSKATSVALSFVLGALCAGALALLFAGEERSAVPPSDPAQTRADAQDPNELSDADSKPKDQQPNQVARVKAVDPTVAKSHTKDDDSVEEAESSERATTLADLLAIAEARLAEGQSSAAEPQADRDAPQLAGNEESSPDKPVEEESRPTGIPPAAAPVQAAAGPVAAVAQDMLPVAYEETHDTEPTTLQIESTQDQQVSNRLIQIGPNLIVSGASFGLSHAVIGRRLGPLPASERLAALSYRPTNLARKRGAYALIGQTAPPFNVTRWTEGDRLPLTGLSSSDKVVVVFAFMASSNRCQELGFPVTRLLELAFAHRNDVEFLYIQSPHEAHAVNSFSRLSREKQTYGIARPMAQDHVGMDGIPATMRSFHTAGTPWHIVIDKDRIIRFNDFARSYDFYERMIRALL